MFRIPLAVALAVAAVAPPAPQPAAAAVRSDVIVHLMEWKWTDIKKECATVLGPAGFGAVQVSPPQEHAVLRANETGGTDFPWWQRYQPVSYKLDSRSGSRAEFADMVATCKQHGVKIYVDAIVNHMTGRQASGTGSAGSTYRRYDYPGVYGDADFHGCRRDISNWDSREEIHNCELLGLVDLKTEHAGVRSALTAYLQGLLDLGVAGFRIDAAKHMPVADLQAIKAGLRGSVDIYSEVLSDWAGGPVPMREYEGLGALIEHRYGKHLGDLTLNNQWSRLNELTAGRLAPDGKHVVYTDSHDTQRSRGTLTYHSGLYDLGNVFMLAWPYGRPMLMSSYRFSHDNTNVGPPSNGSGQTSDVDCASGAWICEHRRPAIANLVGFRAAVGAAPVTQWTSAGTDRIAFARQGRGFVAINAGSSPWSGSFATDLPGGVYCDVTRGVLAGGSCTGPTVTVAADGRLSTTVAATAAVALHVGARLGDAPGSTAVGFEVTASTWWGQNVYAVGSVPELGSWDTARAVPMSADTYPIWKATVNLPVNTLIEYKYIKKNPDGHVEWESDPNRSFTTGTTPTTRRDAWR